MRQGGAGASAPRLRAGRTLVIAQVAIAVPLVVGAALFLRTIHNLASVDLGFEPRGLVLFKMDPTLNGYTPARTQELYRQVLQRLEAVPGVRHATLVENALLSGWVSNTSFSVDGAKPRSMLMNRVGPGFFDTLGLPIIAGRGLGLQDGPGGAPTAVLNEAAVRRFFAGANPIGRTVVMAGAEPVTLQIVGVARDAKYDSVKQQAVATIYLPYFQSTGLGAMHVAVRSEGNVQQAIRAAVAEVDRDVPITGMKTQAQQMDETIGSERALTILLVFFGVFALLLACIGLHGVTAYSVARRTSEIGIRLALGAQRQRGAVDDPAPGGLAGRRRVADRHPCRGVRFARSAGVPLRRPARRSLERCAWRGQSCWPSRCWPGSSPPAAPPDWIRWSACDESRPANRLAGKFGFLARCVEKQGRWAQKSESRETNRGTDHVLRGLALHEIPHRVEGRSALSQPGGTVRTAAAVRAATPCLDGVGERFCRPGWTRSFLQAVPARADRGRRRVLAGAAREVGGLAITPERRAARGSSSRP